MMGPIGCLFGLIAQIIHMAILVIVLPIALIYSFFGDRDNEG